MSQDEIEARKKKAERGWLADPAPPPPREYIPGEERQVVPDDGRPESTGAETRAGTSGGSQVSQFNSDDQWRSFQTFIAAYLFGMPHRLDVFTISRRKKAAPPLVEFRFEADGILRFSVGDLAWSDDPGEFVLVRREGANRVALQTVELLRSLDDIDEPRAVRLSGSGPASSVAVLAKGGFLSGGEPDTVHIADDRRRRHRRRCHRGRSPQGGGPRLRRNQERFDRRYRGRPHAGGASDVGGPVQSDNGVRLSGGQAAGGVRPYRRSGS